MQLEGIKYRLQDILKEKNYVINTSPSKGEMIKGFDQFSIRWSEGGLEKLIQIYPEISRSGHIKNWNIWICASKDTTKGRYWWKKTVCTKRSKSVILGLARTKIEIGIQELNQIEETDLEFVLEWD